MMAELLAIQTPADPTKPWTDEARHRVALWVVLRHKRVESSLMCECFREVRYYHCKYNLVWPSQRCVKNHMTAKAESAAVYAMRARLPLEIEAGQLQKGFRR